MARGTPNNWIAVDCEIHEDSKTKAVARASGLPLNECVGAVVRILGRMRRKAPKGELAPVLNDDLNEWAGYAADHAFAAQFVAHFCDETRKVFSWMEYNGKMLEQSRKSVRRIRNYRNRKKKERRDAAKNVTRNAPRTKRERSRSPNPTQPNPSGVGDGGGAAVAGSTLEGSPALPEVQELAAALTVEQKNAIRAEHGLPPLKVVA